MIKIGIASDHAGYEMKEFLVGYLDAMGYEVLDFGTHSPDSVDYADFAHMQLLFSFLFAWGSPLLSYVFLT